MTAKRTRKRVSDKERIDWLTGRLCGIYRPDAADGRPLTWEAWDGKKQKGFQGLTIRQAIDAAIRSERARKGRK